ncbi:GAF and ANTAR domain-containing protein [Streptomyces sp. NPDC051554]|uniref:GAF and ANTAR domain-containing protein n=1 Tax=Streptomyces sp. NPDC051554 TaxID=3365656 RepID=UPI0037A9B174
MSDDRERSLVRLFLEAADTLVDDFDPVDFLVSLADQATVLLGVPKVGIVLKSKESGPLPVAASDDNTELLDLLRYHHKQGPWLDCFHVGQPVLAAGWDDIECRWPDVAADLRTLGHSRITALPMRLREETIGGLSLFHDHPVAARDVYLAQSLANIAAISLLQQRAIAQGVTLNGQLHRALESHHRIQQAKGFITARLSLGPEEAFGLLRDTARRRRQLLSVLAEQLLTDPRGTDLLLKSPNPKAAPASETS